MDFSNLSQVRTQLATLNSEYGEYLFEVFGFNGFEIQIMIGGYFSEPTILLPTPLHYKKVSVLVYEQIKSEQHQVNPCLDERFKQYDWCKYFHYIDGMGKDKSSYMGTCMPVDELCQLVRAVYKTSRLKLFY